MDRIFVPVAPLAALVRGQQAAGAPITFVVEQDGDHFSIIKSAQTRVLDFLRHAEGEPAPVAEWVGVKRGREVLTMNAEGDTMTERFANPPDGPPYTIVWKRVN